MTNQQIKLIKNSWQVFQKVDPEIVADVFYSKLFADNNALRRMFPVKMQEQYMKLIDMINIIVERLDKLHEITGHIEDMAKRHVDYGVKIEHYHHVGTALLFTLEKGLATRWTDKIKEAWTICYTTLANLMIKAAYPSK